MRPSSQTDSPYNRQKETTQQIGAWCESALFSSREIERTKQIARGRALIGAKSPIVAGELQSQPHPRFQPGGGGGGGARRT